MNEYLITVELVGGLEDAYADLDAFMADNGYSTDLADQTGFWQRLPGATYYGQSGLDPAALSGNLADALQDVVWPEPTVLMTRLTDWGIARR